MPHKSVGTAPLMPTQPSSAMFSKSGGSLSRLSKSVQYGKTSAAPGRINLSVQAKLVQSVTT